MSDLFKLAQNQTTFKKELVAALTTFSTMAYIIFVNPAILSKAGIDFESAMIATCIAAATGSILTGLLSNYPFAQAPGMGLNAFFVYTVVFQSGYSWQGALAIVFISGIVFIVLTATGLRAAIAHAFPKCILHAIPAGIGLFITLIGLNNAGVIDINQGPIIEILTNRKDESTSALIGAINKAPPQILEFGDFSNTGTALAIGGFILMSILMVKNVKTAILSSIVVISILSLAIGHSQLPDHIALSTFDLSPTFLKLDFNEILTTRNEANMLVILVDLFMIIVAFTMVDLFDTLGTLYGTAEKGGFLTKNGKLPRMNSALMADAIATTVGSLLGTSTTTTYIESGTGIAAGGKTGLTAVIVGILFLICIFLAPLAGLIPTAATAPALIMVGVLMLGSIQKINFTKLEEGIPAFLVIVLMPFTYSIANGIGAGIIVYTLIQLVTGRLEKINLILLIISLLFLLKFILI